MPETRICDSCGWAFDWEGIEEHGYVYCCAECARGEECTCPQHDHEYRVHPGHGNVSSD